MNFGAGSPTLLGMNIRATALVLAAGCTEPTLTSTMSEVNLNDFVLPSLSAAERAAIVRNYNALDPDNLVPRGLLEDAIIYFDLNHAVIPRTNHFVVVDLSRFSGRDRFWMIDVATGSVEAHKVAHGDGSDPDNDGLATLFSNVEGSHMSSLGFYLTGEIYDGTHIHSMRLDGLSRDGSPNNMANTNVRSRLVVVHEASYVDDTNDDQQGRSNGCLALDPTIERHVVDTIHDGSLIYVATRELAAPVGRGDGTMPPADDPNHDDQDPNPPTSDDSAMGGCAAATPGSAIGAIVMLVAFAPLRRRRRE